MPHTFVLTASPGCISSKWEVLEGGRMEDDVGPVLLEHLAHPLGVPDVGNDEVPRVEQARPSIESWTAWSADSSRSSITRFARPRARDLAAELGPDRAAGARDQDRTVGDRFGDPGEIRLDLLATEQVLTGDLADVLDPERSVQLTGTGMTRTSRPALVARKTAPRTVADDRRAIAMRRTCAP